MKNYIYMALLAAAAILSFFMDLNMFNRLVIVAVCVFGIVVLLPKKKEE